MNVSTVKSLPPTVDIETRGCPLGCEDADEMLFTARDLLHDLPGEFPVVRCRHCGLARTNPRPTPDTMSFYYPAHYAPYHDADQRPEAATPSASAARRLLRRLTRVTTRHVPPIAPGHMLEVGCASGAFMSEMAQVGWNCEGIEFSDSAAQRARALGFRVQTASLETADEPLAPLDLCVGWMVVEHLHDPVFCLRRLRSWMNPDGWLAVSVPDIAALDFRVTGPLWYGLHVPNHLYHFSHATVARLLTFAGWRVRRTIWHKNAATPLRSLAALARTRRKPAVVRLLEHIDNDRSLRHVRWASGVLLGALRQSGRVTVWAQPAGE
jgi:SAM-dependent methyltransferase